MPEARPNSQAIISRQRWDCYFVPGVVLAFAIGTYTVAAFDNWRPMLAASVVVFIWLYIRFATPKAGMPAQKISASTGSLQIVVLSAAFFVLTVFVTLVDIFLLGHRFRDPLQAYHIALYTPPWVLYLVGVHVLDRRYGKSRCKAIG